MGADVSKLYVDGEDLPRNFTSLKRDVWMHVYIECTHEFDDDVNIMSGVITGEESAGVAREGGYLKVKEKAWAGM